MPFKLSFWDGPKVQREELKAKKDAYFNSVKLELAVTNPANPPRSLRCPIGLGLLKNPVITKWGNVYSHDAIKKHLKKNKLDPLNIMPLEVDEVFEFSELDSLIQDYIEIQRKYLRQKESKLSDARKIAHNGVFQDPELFICPISNKMITAAMLSADGKVYDESSLKEANYLTPVFNDAGGKIKEEKFTSDYFEPFHAFTQQINLFEIYRAEQPSVYQTRA